MFVRQQEIRTLNLHESCIIEPTSVLLLRIGFARVKLTYQTQIETYRLRRRDTRVIENLTDDVYPAAWIDCSSNVLHCKARIL